MERFRAYEGKEPFAFISYAHMNSDRVYEIISALHSDGFRIWYDQGIEIARRYKAVVNEHIEKCAVFVVFATREGINRPEVIDECAYAIALRKKMVIVYLEDIPAEELDAVLRATFTINQRIMWHGLADWERQYKLREALAVCKGENKAQPVADGGAAAQKKTAENNPDVQAVSAAAGQGGEYRLSDNGRSVSGNDLRMVLSGIVLFLLPNIICVSYQ